MANTTGKKYGGRKKGTPNRTTTEIRDAFKNVLDDNIDNLDDWLNTLAKKSPEKAINILLKISEFILPKLTKIEVDEVPVDKFAHMTDEELEAEIKKFCDKYSKL